MGAPTKEADKPKVEAVAQPAYVVARGRTVSVDGKSIGPGKPVTLAAADIPHLLKGGFIVPAEAESDEPTQGVRVGGLQIRGGTRPGASVA
jgi:hypothetical protein